MLVLKVEEGPEPRNVEKERKWDLSWSLQNAALLDTLTVPSETPAGLLTSRAVGNEPACSSHCVVVSYRSVRKLHPPAVISLAVHSRVPWYLHGTCNADGPCRCHTPAVRFSYLPEPRETGLSVGWGRLQIVCRGSLRIRARFSFRAIRFHARCWEGRLREADGTDRGRVPSRRL